jgi:hypothetical protein
VGGAVQKHQRPADAMNWFAVGPLIGDGEPPAVTPV